MVNTSSTGIRNGFISVAFRSRDVFVNSLHQVTDLLFIFRVAVQSAESGANDNRHFIMWIVIGREESLISISEVDQFRIIYLVSFVQEYNDIASTPTCLASRMCSRSAASGRQLRILRG